MATQSIEQLLPTETDTDQIGSMLANGISDGMVIYLIGGLGAGKTRLAQAIIKGLGFSGHVKSPTYTLVETYRVCNRTVYHFDLYRLMDPMELEFMGIQDYFEEKHIILIEWPDKGQGMIGDADIAITLSYADPGRKLSLDAVTERGRELLSKLKQNL